MSCSTCGCSMAMIFNATRHKAYHCPRCGTIRSERLGHEDVYVPKLVERCRQFEDCLHVNTHQGKQWLSLGVEEAIHPPEARPT